MKNLEAFLRRFPSLRKLRLANWTYALSPNTMMSYLRGTPEDDTVPAFMPTLGILRNTTKIEDVWLLSRRWNAPHRSSALSLGRVPVGFTAEVLKFNYDD